MKVTFLKITRTKKEIAADVVDDPTRENSDEIKDFLAACGCYAHHTACGVRAILPGFTSSEWQYRQLPPITCVGEHVPVHLQCGLYPLRLRDLLFVWSPDFADMRAEIMHGDSSD
jgi:hypothetical protein